LKPGAIADKNALIQAAFVRIPDATERNVLIRCAFVGGLLCLAPGDVASMGILWLVALGLHLWHRKLLRLEGATATPAAAGAPPPPEASADPDAPPPPEESAETDAPPPPEDSANPDAPPPPEESAETDAPDGPPENRERPERVTTE
jgi:hypothetical protein